MELFSECGTRPPDVQVFGLRPERQGRFASLRDRASSTLDPPDPGQVRRLSGGRESSGHQAARHEPPSVIATVYATAISAKTRQMVRATPGALTANVQVAVHMRTKTIATSNGATSFSGFGVQVPAGARNRPLTGVHADQGPFRSCCSRLTPRIGPGGRCCWRWAIGPQPTCLPYARDTGAATSRSRNR